MTPIAHLIERATQERRRGVLVSIHRATCKGCQMVRRHEVRLDRLRTPPSWQKSAFERDESVPWFQFKQWDGKVIREWPLLKIINGTDHSSIQRDRIPMPSHLSLNSRYFKPRSSQTVKYQACSATPCHQLYVYYA